GILAGSGSTAGPGIAKRLADELKKAGLKVVDGAGEVEISGEARSSKGGLRLDLKAKDEDGKTVAAFDKVVNDEEDRIIYEGPTLPLPKKADGEKPKDTDERRAAALNEATRKPDFEIVGKTQLVPRGAPYAIEILVKGKPLVIQEKDGRPVVQLND